MQPHLLLGICSFPRSFELMGTIRGYRNNYLQKYRKLQDFSKYLTIFDIFKGNYSHIFKYRQCLHASVLYNIRTDHNRQGTDLPLLTETPFSLVSCLHRPRAPPLRKAAALRRYNQERCRLSIYLPSDQPHIKHLQARKPPKRFQSERSPGDQLPQAG